MAQLLLKLTGITLSFGGRPLLDGVDLMLSEGEKLCLVGRNGSGKSTLLKIAGGHTEQDKGERFVQPGTTLRYLPQEPDFMGFATVRAYVEAGLGPTDSPHMAGILMQELGLTGDEDPARLSGGEARRASLARTLAPSPDMLFLDEPTNHLDLPIIEWLEQRLTDLRSAMIVISHDRRFLAKLTNRTIWLDRGQGRRMERGFAHFEEWRDQILDEEERAQALLSQRIATEEHWMRYGVTARRKRNMRRVELLSSLRKERKDHVQRLGGAKLEASVGGTSGQLVAELIKVSKSFGPRKIVANLDLMLLRGDRLAIVGPNGAGKTTLLKLLTGDLEADSGTIKGGSNVQTVTLEQNRASLQPTDLVGDVITAGRGSSVTINGETRHVVTYMKDFLFRPEQARSPVSVLSGGEQARLILARELARPSNLLVLDEPTNDLDMETLDILEELLADYRGTILLVSHDRDFIDRLATSTLMYEGDGNWIEYAGGYTDMLAQRGEGVTARKVEVKSRVRVSAAKAPSPVDVPRRKLSFKEKHALETLPGKIAGLEKEIAGLTDAMADPGLFNRDPRKFSEVSVRLSAAQAEIHEAEELWLEMEMLREEIEAAQ